MMLCACIALKAQYFQHVYGVPVKETLTSGINTKAQGLGYFMAGSNVGYAMGVPSVSASFTDVSGNVPASPYFDNEYIVVTNSGVPLHTQDPQVFEYNNGNGFGIVGRYDNPTSTSQPNTGIYFLQLDKKGTVLNAFDYTVNNSGTSYWNVIKVSAIAESASGKEIYVTGWLQPNFSQVNCFVLKIDAATGAVIWSYVYDLINPSSVSKDLANDIIESPYANEVIVVGETYDSGPGYGFFMSLNSTNGAPTSSVRIFGTNNSRDAFNAIKVAGAPATGGPGFIIGGSSDVNGSNDFWLTLVKPTGAFIWSTLHDYGLNPNANNQCFDLIERKNTSGKYEYYMVGSVEKGNFGKSDVLVVKTDENGKGVSAGEFTYGAGDYDYGKSIDQYNGTTADGLSIFGTFNKNIIGSSDMYLVRAYFDGKSGCNEAFSTPPPKAGPKQIAKYDVKDLTKIKGTKFLWRQTSAKDDKLCFALTIPGASNARVAPINEEGNKHGTVGQTLNKHVQITPNPSNFGTPSVNLTVESDIVGDAEVLIYDLMGREFYKGTFTLKEGVNNLPLNIASADISAGMYKVVITNGITKLNTMMMVK